ncbi:MAG: endopeptidase La, partial [Hyphomonadaceae bacterium]|nr:endopeptidase La [Clostridia bacterium]
MPTGKKAIKVQILPLIPLRGITIFPSMILHFDVGRPKSVQALEEAMLQNQMIFLVSQKDVVLEDPNNIDDLNLVGTVARIKQLLKLPSDTIRVLVEGVSRAKLSEITQNEPFFMCEVVEKYDIEPSENAYEMEALVRVLRETFDEYQRLSVKITPDIVNSVANMHDFEELADMIAANVLVKQEDKQAVLDEFEITTRMEVLIGILTREVEILAIEKKIANEVKKKLDQNQKEYYLREQLKVIQTELGEKEGLLAEAEEYLARIAQAGLSQEALQKATKEAERLKKMSSASPEVGVIRTYLDWMLDLPWKDTTSENFDIKQAEQILDDDHYGLEKVKERILEFLAVRKLSGGKNAPILCLAGPPGVGKTSIAKSVARALNRKYVRISLGGVRDEAEIRGHRKTYVGSMPGRIINALKQAGSKNALILLDEIDKMSNDFRGDPASAMLEVLDSEQNHNFRDHYMEVGFDLSQILFFTTANRLDTVPPALLDRMEILHISGYTEEEKIQIATRYLLPKQIERHGLKKTQCKVEVSAIRDIIQFYTREAGVRSLEREIGNLCRKAARILVEGTQKTVTVNSRNIEKYLGTKRFRVELAGEKDEIGIATGLAWTSVGGETLSIEVNVMEGSGKVELTGHLGDVMKESARAAISYIRSRSDDFDIDKDFYKKMDIHIHVPEGATPKDGPSAGITMATALISALSGSPVYKSVAMTGEITLRGRVLPIGGLKEKALAAFRAGIQTIIIPFENKKDLADMPPTVLKAIKFVIAHDMDIVLKTALHKRKTTKGNTSIPKQKEVGIPFTSITTDE